MKAIIVDDEPLGLKRMRKLLEAHEDVRVVAECRGGREAVAEIASRQPDIAFLDIHMPDLDGFEVIRELAENGVTLPVVVFVTAHDQHAVEAFSVHALDYLLKPVSAARLAETLDRIRTELAREPNAITRERLLAWLREEEASRAPDGAALEQKMQRIEVKDRGATHFVPLKEVIYLEAEGNYVAIHTREKEHLLRGTLAALEETLDPKCFFRINRSVIVRMACVKSLRVVGRDHYADLVNGKSFPVTRSPAVLAGRLRFAM